MKAIILQHEINTPPGTTVEWLKQNQIKYEILNLFEDFLYPALSDFELLIICGGTMNVDETARISWLQSEKEFINKCIQANKKIVGLCLGSQLLAESLGAKVGRHPLTEMGWQQVELLNNSTLPVQADHPVHLDVFQFHSYSFELPKEATLLATNDACKYQAFIYKNNILGFQFHPESTHSWITECAIEDNLPVGPFCQTKEEILSQLEKQKILQNWYFDYLSRFIRL